MSRKDSEKKFDPKAYFESIGQGAYYARQQRRVRLRQLGFGILGIIPLALGILLAQAILTLKSNLGPCISPLASIVAGCLLGITVIAFGKAIRARGDVEGY